MYRSANVLRSTSVTVRGQHVGWFSLSTVWASGIKFRLSGFVTGAFTPWVKSLDLTHFLKPYFVYSHHVCAHTHGHAYPKVCMWRSQDKSVESVPSFHISGFQEWNPNHEACFWVEHLPWSVSSFRMPLRIPVLADTSPTVWPVTGCVFKAPTFHTCHSNSLTSRSLQRMKWPLHIAHSDAAFGTRCLPW